MVNLSLPDSISVRLNNGDEFTVAAEDVIYADPTYGQFENGLLCFSSANDNEYFISEAGIVWSYPDNNEVGVAPMIQSDFDARMQRLNELIEVGEGKEF